MDMTNRTHSIKYFGNAGFGAAFSRRTDFIALAAEAIYEAFFRRALRAISRTA